MQEPPIIPSTYTHVRCGYTLALLIMAAHRRSMLQHVASSCGPSVPIEYDRALLLTRPPTMDDDLSPRPRLAARLMSVCDPPLQQQHYEWQVSLPTGGRMTVLVPYQGQVDDHLELIAPGVISMMVVEAKRRLAAAMERQTEPSVMADDDIEGAATEDVDDVMEDAVQQGAAMQWLLVQCVLDSLKTRRT